MYTTHRGNIGERERERGKEILSELCRTPTGPHEKKKICYSSIYIHYIYIYIYIVQRCSENKYAHGECIEIKWTVSGWNAFFWSKVIGYLFLACVDTTRRGSGWWCYIIIILYTNCTSARAHRTNRAWYKVIAGSSVGKWKYLIVFHDGIIGKLADAFPGILFFDRYIIIIIYCNRYIYILYYNNVYASYTTI